MKEKNFWQSILARLALSPCCTSWKFLGNIEKFSEVATLTFFTIWKQAHLDCFSFIRCKINITGCVNKLILLMILSMERFIRTFSANPFRFWWKWTNCFKFLWGVLDSQTNVINSGKNKHCGAVIVQATLSRWPHWEAEQSCKLRRYGKWPRSEHDELHRNGEISDRTHL